MLDLFCLAFGVHFQAYFRAVSAFPERTRPYGFSYIRLCEHALDLRKRFRAEDLVFPLNGAHDGHCAPDLSVHPQRKGHGQAAAEPFLIVHGVADAADQLQVFPELFLAGNGCARILDELQTGQIL